ncbi:MAG: hypothetical protein ABEL76_03175 [Bradymonadaceae bacterium]
MARADMRFQTLIYRGVSEGGSTARLDVSDERPRADLPGDTSLADSRAILWALIYPEVPLTASRDLLDAAGDPTFGLVFEVDGTQYRLKRKGEPSSVTLERARSEGFERVEAGAEAVGHRLESRHGRPSVRQFAALNLWQFDSEAVRTGGGVSLEELGPQQRQLVEEYREALEIRRLEETTDELKAEHRAIEEAIGDGLELESKLEQARSELDELEMGVITEDDLDLLRTKDEKLQRLEDELEELAEKERRERDAIAETEPAPLWRNGQLWVGLSLGVASIAASVLYPETLRWVAALDLVAFGLVAWNVIVHLTDLERANIHRVRVDSIRRRTEEVRQEIVDIRERVDHLLVHADAEDEIELLDRSRKARRLRDMIDRLEDQVASYRQDPEFVRRRDRANELEDRLEELAERRSQLPDYPPDPYQLEMQLDRAGVDPEAVGDEVDSTGAPASQTAGPEAEEGRRPFEMLGDVADEVGLSNGGRLSDEPRRLWRKMAGHVLGDSFAGIGLTADGGVRIDELTEDQVAMWRETKPSEVRMAAELLALALQLSLSEGAPAVETVWAPDPSRSLVEEGARRMEEVVDNASQRCHLVLVGP